MNTMQRITELMEGVGVASVVATTGNNSTAAIALSKGARFLFVVNTVTLSGGATVDFAVQWCVSSGGTYANITGSTLTQVTAGGKMSLVEVSAEQVLAFAPTAQFLKGKVTVATANGTATVVAFATVERFLPVAQASAIVDQTVTANS